MGFQDRAYYRDEEPVFGRSPSGGQGASMVFILIGINVAFFFANFLLGRDDELTRLMAVDGTIGTKPGLWWKLITCGFAHDYKYL